MTTEKRTEKAETGHKTGLNRAAKCSKVSKSGENGDPFPKGFPPKVTILSESDDSVRK